MRILESILDGTTGASGNAPRVIHSPHDDRIVAEAHPARPDQVERAVAAAVKAKPVMQAMPSHERARILDQVALGVRAKREEFARLLLEEAGKPITLARLEADRCVQTITDAAHWARRPPAEAIPLDGFPPGTGRCGILRRFPVGVIAAITPFNFPLNLVAHKLATAIAAGCPVILKPASQTPSAAILLAEIITQAGLPAGALQVLLLSGADAGVLVTDERIAMVTFTGSAEVGWGIKARAGHKKVTLELGGNAAAIVEPDSDWENAAARLAHGAFAYAGQSCISVQRIYVQETITDRFTEALIAAATAFPTGDPSDEKTLCGPLIDAANAERVMNWIARAQTRGGRLLCGNHRQENVVSPTVIVDAPEDAEVSCQEVFGPVVTLSSYRDFRDALHRVNNSRYGLQAGVFTNDVRKLWRAFDTLEVGGIIHNDAPTFRVDAMPYGGVKDSGIGREGARWAIEEMIEPRLLVLSTG
ncbi:MAG: aldehyde dehydrogenase family protein [Candidatus Zixiibacteriota bacterium]